MQEDGGGSFWATFGGGSNGAEASALEKLLQTPQCSVEALLDEEEVIQEFKTGNPNLVARLSEPDAIKVLMDCITLDPPPEANNARCYRYPFVAVELMTCAPPKFLELLVSKESNAMDLLWSGILTRKPSEVNPVLAGYFSRTATALMSKYKMEVLDYLRARGPEQLLQEFLDRIHLRSLAELLARLLSGESEREVVFQTSNLVARFLSRWKEDSNSDAQENITLVLAELCSQKESLCWIEDLTTQLTEPNTVQFLIDHIFTQPSGVPPAMSLLTTVIIHTAGKEGAEVCTSTPSLSPLAPPREDIPSVSLDEPVVGEAAPAKVMSPTVTQITSQSTSEWMERRRGTLMREVAGHFSSFRRLLDDGLKEGAHGTLAMPQGSIKSVGGTTLEVISLITTLSRSGLDVILESLLKNQLLPRCLQVFFQHPWSSLLHNCVKQLVTEVLSGSDGLRQQLSMQLLKEGCLAEKLVEEYRAEAAWKSAKRKHARVGYMGHLFLMSGALQDCKSREVSELLKSTSGWSEVVAQAEATKKLHNEQLGGGVPASDRGLASSRIAPESSERTESDNQVAACPAWSKRVSGGNFLAAEPIDLQESQDPAESSASATPAIPNGEGSAASSPIEDTFNPDFASFETQSGPSWATFPEVAPPSPSEPSFANFATEWPAEIPPSSSWASFDDPAPFGSEAQPARKDERLPLDSQLSQLSGGGASSGSHPVATPAPPSSAPPGLSAQQAPWTPPPEVPKPEAAKPKSAPSAPLSEELGAENLFALIGDGFAPRSTPQSRPEPMPSTFQAISTATTPVPKQPSVVSSPWAPASPTPWDPGYGLPPPSGTGSWIGDFDPLADSKGTPSGSKVTPKAPSASSELAFLDFLK